MLYKLCFRPVLFGLSRHDPEEAHEWVLTALKKVGRKDVTRNAIASLTRVSDARLSQTLFGLQFPNPIGLAAGFDKNAEAVDGLAALGFGFLELGTVTQHKQPGRDRPRIFRYPRDRAIIDRMGFPNDGAATIRNRLMRWGKPAGVPLGISIGKSARTPLEEAVSDYLFSLRTMYDVADYFAVNVSSPNTAGLRQLQSKELLRELLSALTREAAALSGTASRKPILVKISPDLSDHEIVDVLDVCFQYEIDGIIAVNTTLARVGMKTPTNEVGGMSGKPLSQTAEYIVRFIRREVGSRMPIIGVGGIFTAGDAYRMLLAGANLIQIYTSLVYEGPFIVKRINKGLLRILRKEGLKSIGQLNPITQGH